MDDAEKEKARFYNFLKRYDLDRYYDKLIKVGVCKISHLKDVEENDLMEIGMHKPERIRLKKKFEENFSTMGKLKVIIYFGSYRSLPYLLEIELLSL